MRSFTRLLVCLGIVLCATSARAVNNEPPQCLSPDPTQWPPAAKPYFMLAVDTSSAMATPLPFKLCSTNADCTGSGAGTVCNCFTGGPTPCGVNNGACNGVPPPCAGYPGNRSGHLRCALDLALQGFGGQVDLGLAGFALTQTNCSNPPACTTTIPFSCFTKCSYSPYPGDTTNGCGPQTTAGDPTTREGANILVPLQWDHFWQSAPASCTQGTQCPSGICSGGACSPSNVPQLLGWFDNDLTGNQEVWANGKTPINGVLRDLYRYLAGTYVVPGTTTSIPTPLDPTNERACRSINVILIVAGDENCDTYTDATNAATALYNGVTVGNFTWNVRTHVIAFVAGMNAAVIAGAGASSTQTGTTAGHGYYANPTNAVQLQQAIANIVQSALQAETCDNVDNNCNGCTDEGFNHYCDVGQSCCANATPAQRAACLASYQASITPQNPQGDPTLLPCTDANAGVTPSTWLCSNPGDVCDNADNNCNGQVDEGDKKCGSPLHCPTSEVCNGIDDNCNGVIDEGPSGVPYSVCPNMCQPTPEVCDGCDNDCDGAIDDNIGPLGACGLPPNPPQTPAYCSGTLVCVPGA